jgi:hypothetical protein
MHNKATRIIQLVKNTARTFVEDLKKIVIDADTQMTETFGSDTNEVIGSVLVVVATALYFSKNPYLVTVAGALSVIAAVFLNNDGGSVTNA